MAPREVVLVADRDPLSAAAFGLGNGGIDDRHAPGQLHFDERVCVTPGGVRIECQVAGVKFSFPSGRELLVAPDGFLHLRGGENAGPFAAGVELRLGDGAIVRIVLNPSQRRRLRDVVIVAGERVLQPWRRGDPAVDTARDQPWPGVKLACVGDGGDVYRLIGMGPMIVLDRLLVEKAREEVAPTERIALLTAPLVQSMARMPRQHTESDAAVRGAVSAVAAVADRGSDLFPDGALLERVERDRLRWLLSGGWELELIVDGMKPRLGLYAGMSKRPLVEWQLGVSPAAFLGNPNDDQPGDRPYHGNGTRLLNVATDLQAREALFERTLALGVLSRMLHPEDGKSGKNVSRRRR
ncbi:MAG: hypothetical protein H6838_04405 [Planctomycetes bacterium]|nr:hypothetical protein [Planctomycetota bacterium]MCB9884708.1 hypothetical protein [Planctomycetota bacterium]